MSKLMELLGVIQEKVVFIQTHNYPDQDALATAHGLKVLLEHHGKQAIVCYKGEIDKYNTIKMIELLNLDIVPADSIEFRDDDEIILVDCQAGNVNVQGYSGRVIACIDHHPIQDTSMYRFHDIRPNAGACATIIADYFYENNIYIDRLVATSLLYGIRMDTNMLSRAVSDLDLEMYCNLYKLASRPILRQLDSCTLKLPDLITYHTAITNLKIFHSLALVDLGPDCSEAIMGQIADFLLTLREVDVVFGHSYRDNGVKFTVRSSKPELNASEVIRTALATFGDGGGHETMAAGFVPDVPNTATSVTVANIAEDRAVQYVAGIMNWTLEKKGMFRKMKHMLNVWNATDGRHKD